MSLAATARHRSTTYSNSTLKNARADYASAKLFAHNVRAIMAEAMEVPTTEHSYEDVRLAGVANALHMPANDAMLEIGKAKKFLTGVSMKTIEKHLSAFAAMDTNHTGQVTFEQFAEAFELKQENGEMHPGALRMFELIDTHGHEPSTSRITSLDSPWSTRFRRTGSN